MVDAVDHGQIGAVAGGGDEHLLGPGLEMLGHGRVALGEEAGALHHHVDAKIAPRQRLGVAFGGDRDRALAEIDRIFARGDLAGKHAVYRIVLQEPCAVGRRAEVVDADEFDVVAPGLVRRAQDQPSDPPEPVDAHSYRHRSLSKVLLCVSLPAPAPVRGAP